MDRLTLSRSWWLVGLLTCGAGCSSPRWLMYQANSAHTGHLPGVVHAVPLERIWTRTFPDAVLTPPVVGHGTVFMTAANVLYALSSADGSTRWTHHASVGGFWSGVAVMGNRVYAVNRAADGSDDGKVSCLRASNGSLRWRESVREGSVAPVTVAGNHVYVHAKPCGLHLFHAQDGHPQSQCSGGDCQVPNSKAAAVLAGRAYIATAMDVYYCDDSGANGPVGAWGTLSGARSTPMLVQLDDAQSTEHALVVRRAGQIRAVKPEDGAPYWSALATNTEDEGVASAPGSVYYFHGTQVVARRARDGVILWTHENVKPPRFSPVVTDNLVYYVDTTHLHALDRMSGQDIWSEAVRKEQETGGAGLALMDQGLLAVVADRVIAFHTHHIAYPH